LTAGLGRAILRINVIKGARPHGPAPASRPISFVFSRNPPTLKPFYTQVLGLTVISEDNFAIAFDLGAGAMLRLTNLPDHVAAPHTAFGFAVDDIRATIATLRAKGVALPFTRALARMAMACGKARRARRKWPGSPTPRAICSA
jgi:hypothetical protein